MKKLKITLELSKFRFDSLPTCFINLRNSGWIFYRTIIDGIDVVFTISGSTIDVVSEGTHKTIYVELPYVFRCRGIRRYNSDYILYKRGQRLSKKAITIVQKAVEAFNNEHCTPLTRNKKLQIYKNNLHLFI